MRDVTVRAVDAYVRRCFENETPPRVAELAATLGLSRSRLNESFGEVFGVSPSAYLKQKQIEYAAQLLRATTLTSSQVAYKAGFGTRRTLFRTFRREVNATPRSFRQADKMSLASPSRKA